MEEISVHPKKPPANGHREAYSRRNYIDVLEIHGIEFRERKDAIGLSITHKNHPLPSLATWQIRESCESLVVAC
jgi:hypothetical protein